MKIVKTQRNIIKTIQDIKVETELLKKIQIEKNINWKIQNIKQKSQRLAVWTVKNMEERISGTEDDIK